MRRTRYNKKIIRDILMITIIIIIIITLFFFFLFSFLFFRWKTRGKRNRNFASTPTRKVRKNVEENKFAIFEKF